MNLSIGHLAADSNVRAPIEGCNARIVKNTHFLSRSNERVIRLACEARARRADITKRPHTMIVNATEKIAILRALRRPPAGTLAAVATSAGEVDWVLEFLLAVAVWGTATGLDGGFAATATAGCASETCSPAGASATAIGLLAIGSTVGEAAETAVDSEGADALGGAGASAFGATELDSVEFEGATGAALFSPPGCADGADSGLLPL